MLHKYFLSLIAILCFSINLGITQAMAIPNKNNLDSYQKELNNIRSNAVILAAKMQKYEQQ